MINFDDRRRWMETRTAMTGAMMGALLALLIMICRPAHGQEIDAETFLQWAEPAAPGHWPVRETPTDYTPTVCRVSGDYGPRYRYDDTGVDSPHESRVETTSMSPGVWPDWTDGTSYFPSQFRPFLIQNASDAGLFSEYEPIARRWLCEQARKADWTSVYVTSIDGGFRFRMNDAQAVVMIASSARCPSCWTWIQLPDGWEAAYKPFTEWDQKRDPVPLTELLNVIHTSYSGDDLKRALTGIFLDPSTLVYEHAPTDLATISGGYLSGELEMQAEPDIPEWVRRWYRDTNYGQESTEEWIRAGWKEIQRMEPGATWETWMQSRRYLPGDRTPLDMQYTTGLRLGHDPTWPAPSDRWTAPQEFYADVGGSIELIKRGYPNGPGEDLWERVQREGREWTSRVQRMIDDWLEVCP